MGSFEAISITENGYPIYHLGIDSKDKIEAFEESIANVFERAYVRVKMFQLTMAAGWAYYLYCLNQSNNVLLKIDSLQSLQAIRVASIDFGFFTLLMICMVLLIISYKKGIDAMSRRIHFAIQELKYRVAVENEKWGIRNMRLIWCFSPLVLFVYKPQYAVDASPLYCYT